jgi:hypothetical protein
MDVVAGVPGTAWPIGLPGNPVNNLADAITIMAAKDNWNLHLVGARDFAGTYTPVVVNPTVMTDANIAPMKVNSLVGLTIQNTTDGSHGVITANDAQTITAVLVGGATNQWNPGNAWSLTTYPYAVTFNQDITLEVAGDGYDITVAPLFSVHFLGDLSCKSLTNTTGVINIEGDLWTASVTNNRTVAVTGIAHIYGAIVNTDTLTYHGVYPEVAVNTTAINAGETDVLNLALTAGFHWTVDDLVLKSADPGANKVYVKLNKLVNGVLTTINLTTADPNGFEINNLNFNQYWSLNDMFGRDILAGDNIQITVKASAGGPYAVTGSYAHHSD